LQRHAVAVRSQFRYANRLRKQAGIKGGERKGYVPHQLTEDTLQAEGKKVKGGVGQRVIRPSSSKARTEQRSLAELRTAEPGRYSEDLPRLFANRMAEGHGAVAKAELNRKLADMGRTIRKGHDVNLKANEAVFHVVGSDLRKVDNKEVQRVLDKGGAKGRYVVLNEDVVKRALEGTDTVARGSRHHPRTRQDDRRIQASRYGHSRDSMSATSWVTLQNAYLGQAAHKLPANAVRASRTLKAYGRHEQALCEP
jgi:hypothetical protein